jgi:hypothetical protein
MTGRFGPPIASNHHRIWRLAFQTLENVGVSPAEQQPRIVSHDQLRCGQRQQASDKSDEIATDILGSLQPNSLILLWCATQSAANRSPDLLCLLFPVFSRNLRE